MEDGSVMINILYEDNHLLVVEKKVGVLSQSDGTNTPDMLTVLKQYIISYIKFFNAEYNG